MPNDQSAALAQLRADHIRGVNTRDVELVLRDYADDLVYLTPGMDPIIGKAGLRAFITPLYQHARFNIDMTPQRVDIDGDSAFEWGYVSGETRASVDEEPVAMRMRYVLVYRYRSEGSWEIKCASMNEGATEAHGKV